MSTSSGVKTRKQSIISAMTHGSSAQSAKSSTNPPSNQSKDSKPSKAKPAASVKHKQDADQRQLNFDPNILTIDSDDLDERDDEAININQQSIYRPNQDDDNLPESTLDDAATNIDQSINQPSTINLSIPDSNHLPNMPRFDQITIGDSDDDQTNEQPKQKRTVNQNINRPQPSSNDDSNTNAMSNLDQALHQAAIGQINQEISRQRDRDDQQSNQQSTNPTLPAQPRAARPPASNLTAVNNHKAASEQELDMRRLYTISYPMAQKLGANTDEYEKSLELTITSKNKIGDRYADFVELLHISKNLDANRIAATMSTIFRVPFFPTSLLASDDLNTIINDASITPEFKDWAQVLNSATSFDDEGLLQLPLSLSTQSQAQVIAGFEELLDERTCCTTSFTRENRDPTIRFRMVFVSRTAMLVFGALIQRYTKCLEDSFILQLANQNKALLAQPSCFATKAITQQRSLSINQALQCLRTKILSEHQKSTPELEQIVLQPIIPLSLGMQMRNPNTRYTTVTVTGFLRAPGGYLYVPRMDRVIPNETEALEQISKMIRWNKNLQNDDTVISMPQQDQNQSHKQRDDISVTLRAGRAGLLKWAFVYHRNVREWDLSHMSIKVHLKGADLCFTCHQPGHFTASCPLNRSSAELSTSAATNCPRCNRPDVIDHDCLSIIDVICSLCKQTGHLTTQCPKTRRSWAHLVKPAPAKSMNKPANDASATPPQQHQPAYSGSSSPAVPPPVNSGIRTEGQENLADTMMKMFELNQRSQQQMLSQMLEAQAAFNAQISSQIAVMSQAITGLAQAIVHLPNVSHASSQPAQQPQTVFNGLSPSIASPTIAQAPSSASRRSAPPINSQLNVQTAPQENLQPQYSSRAPPSTQQTAHQSTLSAHGLASRNAPQRANTIPPSNHLEDDPPQPAMSPHVEQAMTNIVNHLLQSIKSVLASTTLSTANEL